MADERRSKAVGAAARLESHARTWRQYLFYVENCRDRRSVVPADCRHHDRFDPGTICEDDAERRASAGREPQQIGMEKSWLGSWQALRVRIFPPSARPGTMAKRMSPIGA